MSRLPGVFFWIFSGRPPPDSVCRPKKPHQESKSDRTINRKQRKGKKRRKSWAPCTCGRYLFLVKKTPKIYQKSTLHEYGFIFLWKFTKNWSLKVRSTGGGKIQQHCHLWGFLKPLGHARRKRKLVCPDTLITPIICIKENGSF